MNPGLPEKYREKVKERRLVTCQDCGHVIATRYKRPKCSKCGFYNNN
ncbi:MAG: hypothetical protein HRO68_00465 [Nitrosopumilus sp.]|nr:hypothetical protein [Nitrosopumilus sp.]